MLLAGPDEGRGASGHVDGVIELTHEAAGSADARWLRVAKLRGSVSLSGRHRFAIANTGIAVFPRIEAAFADLKPGTTEDGERLGFGISGLDGMLAGGLPPGTSTLVLGTPGAGKTLLSLHFLAEGARRGEPGLIASFAEPPGVLAATADRLGLGLGEHLASGLVGSCWQPALEGSPDAWAWELLAIVAAHRPRRLVIDAFTDLARLFADPTRAVQFADALTNALCDHGVTALIVLEIDAFTSPELVAPIPQLSGVMDNGLLLRTAELRSASQRLISVLKLRQSGFDPAIRGFVVGPAGIAVGDPLAASGLLTGTAVPDGQAG